MIENSHQYSDGSYNYKIVSIVNDMVKSFQSVNNRNLSYHFFFRNNLLWSYSRILFCDRDIRLSKRSTRLNSHSDLQLFRMNHMFQGRQNIAIINWSLSCLEEASSKSVHSIFIRCIILMLLDQDETTDMYTNWNNLYRTNFFQGTVSVNPKNHQDQN